MLKEDILFTADYTGVNETIGDRIAEAREQEGLSRMALEDVTGIDHNLLRRYERGERIPCSENLQKISDGVKWTTDYLRYGSIFTTELDDGYVLSCRQLTDKDSLIMNKEGYIEDIVEYINRLSNPQLESIHQIIMFYTDSHNDFGKFNQMIEDYLSEYDLDRADMDFFNKFGTTINDIDVTKVKDMNNLLRYFDLHSANMSFKQMRNITNAIKKVVSKAKKGEEPPADK